MIADDLKEASYRCVTFLDPQQAEVIDSGIAATGLQVAGVEGPSMLSHADLLTTIARAFAFPDYFGHNYNALTDCLRDMSWLPAPGYVLRVRDAETLWRQAPQVGGALVETWLVVAQDWASLEEPVPFHLLFAW